MPPVGSDLPPAMAGVGSWGGGAGGVPAAAGPRPQRRISGREKTAGSRGSGSHATVEQKLRGGKGSRARAGRNQQRYANAVEKLTACEGAASALPSCSGAVSSEAFSVSLFSLFFPPLKYLILSEKPFHEVSAGQVPNQPGSRWLAREGSAIRKTKP